MKKHTQVRLIINTSSPTLVVTALCVVLVRSLRTECNGGLNAAVHLLGLDVNGARFVVHLMTPLGLSYI